MVPRPYSKEYFREHFGFEPVQVGEAVGGDPLGQRIVDEILIALQRKVEKAEAESERAQVAPDGAAFTASLRKVRKLRRRWYSVEERARTARGKLYSACRCAESYGYTVKTQV